MPIKNYSKGSRIYSSCYFNPFQLTILVFPMYLPIAYLVVNDLVIYLQNIHKLNCLCKHVGFRSRQLRMKKLDEFVKYLFCYLINMFTFTYAKNKILRCSLRISTERISYRINYTKQGRAL